MHGECNMTDYRADFTLEPQKEIPVELTLGEQTTIDAELSLDVNILEHDKLTNRDLPDQHPIGAITGLQEILNQIWTFTFEQEIPSDTWVIQHNLGRNPSVTVVDSAGAVQIPDEINYDTDNQITVKFLGSFAGKAFLN